MTCFQVRLFRADALTEQLRTLRTAVSPHGLHADLIVNVEGEEVLIVWSRSQDFTQGELAAILRQKNLAGEASSFLVPL
jgi:hypothetical protein